MADELSSVIFGSIAGGLVSFAFEGIKAWVRRPKLKLAASISISHDPKRPPSKYAFNLTVTNTGGETIHMVRCGILGPCKLNGDQLKLAGDLARLYRSGFGIWRRIFSRRRNLYVDGLLTFDEVVALAPGQPFYIQREDVFDHFALELNGKGVAFAEDSIGRRYTCKFTVPSYESLKRSRGPVEQAQFEELLADWRRQNVRPGLALSVKVNRANRGN